eukprot:CAMPEP_0181289108 /NCGR_PEP_ID=MMETSP1101-20121128/706_1 /TAXON_ID=46948 /ORGANISM="Rhodomonas abbreviata, Strain Caron Lab Isolate" /LENGTH=343 /DNA_ID=CAMNT_0023393307 /DNA_START=1 /DNA_END=1031 /DNA_ORIENTATION=+
MANSARMAPATVAVVLLSLCASCYSFHIGTPQSFSLKPSLAKTASERSHCTSTISSVSMSDGKMDSTSEESKNGDASFNPFRFSRRAAGALLAGAAWQGSLAAAWQVSSLPSSALKWETVEKIAKDPSLAAVAFDKERVDKVIRRWKQANVAITNPEAARAASYTVEFDNFVSAVTKAGKVKIGDQIVSNPSEEQMLQAWKVEELRRAKEREEKGEESLTRPVRLLVKGSQDKTDVFYLPPVVTKDSSAQAIALGKHLSSIGATMYGAFWCSHCYGQKQVLGREVADTTLTYVECDKKGAYNQRDLCKEKKVPGFPTWEIKGELFPGEKSLEELAKISGFKLE